MDGGQFAIAMDKFFFNQFSHLLQIISFFSLCKLVDYFYSAAVSIVCNNCRLWRATWLK